jgi:energy-coupling factor transporter ATP-binding protein EcfA2
VTKAAQPGAAWLVQAFHEVQRHRHLVIYGNIDDLVRWDHGYRPFPTALGDFLAVAGFSAVVRYNLVDGLTYHDDASREFVSRYLGPPGAPQPGPPATASTATAPAASASTRPAGDREVRAAASARAMHEELLAAGRAAPTTTVDALALAHRLLTQTEAPCAVVLDSADLLVGPTSQLTNEHVAQVAHVRRLLAEAALAGPTRLRNTLILVVHELAALPGWLHRDNPHVATVVADKPRLDERATYVAEHLDRYHGGAELTGPERDRAVGALANLTDGMTIVDLAAMAATSRVARLAPGNSRALVARHRFGLREDPWEQLDLAKVRNADDLLSRRVVGQPTAVRAVTDALVNARVGLDFVADNGHAATRPKGVFFFVGPTGVGKTELAKALAELVFDDETALGRFDMSEFSQEHASERLTGAPPGYVGHEQGGALTNWMLERPFSVVLFDEIEKAHPKVWDKFLQIIDDGRLTDGQGRTAHFSHSVVIFTSNLGAQDLPAAAPEYPELAEHFRRSAQRYFTTDLGRPELLGRLGSGIVVFDLLRPSVIVDIVSKFLGQLAAQARRRGYTLEFDRVAVDRAVVEHVMSRGTALGARQIRSPLLEQWVRVPLNRWIMEHSPPAGSRILVYQTGDGPPFAVRRQAADVPAAPAAAAALLLAWGAHILTHRRDGSPARSGGAEVDFLGLDGCGRAPRRGVVGPVHVRVRDHQAGRRRAPLRQVFRRVRIAHQCRVISPHHRAVQGGADALVGLRAGDHEPADAEVIEHALQRGVVERVAVGLRDERLGLGGLQLGHDAPRFAAQGELLAGVLDPDDGHLFPPRLLDQRADVGDDPVALVRALDHAVLYIDDEERGVGPVFECGHFFLTTTDS